MLRIGFENHPKTGHLSEFEDTPAELPHNIYKDVEHQVLRVSRNVLGEKPPQELVHDICVEVALSTPRYRGQCAFTSWVYEVVSRRVHHWIRKESGYRNLLLRAGHGPCAQNPLDPEEAVLTQEHIERIRRALEALPERERVCLFLVRFDLISVQEVAKRLLISPDAVRMNIHRARNHIRKALDGWGDDVCV